MIIDTLLNQIFIPNGRCPICYRVLFFTKEFLCGHCIKKLEIIDKNHCNKCGKQLQRGDIHYCNDCLQTDYSYVVGFSLYRYEGNVRKLIQQIKYNNSPQLGVYMGILLGRHLKLQKWIHEINIIIPVPLHIKRKEERGYNQAEEISMGVADVLQQSSTPFNIHIYPEGLTRIKDSNHQTHLNKSERFSNVKRIFKALNPQIIANKNILLIDDVYTTGATIESCTQELLKNGANKVYFAVLASGRLDIS